MTILDEHEFNSHYIAEGIQLLKKQYGSAIGARFVAGSILKSLERKIETEVES